MKLSSDSADDVVLPEWIFSKYAPALIERLKTEIGGASFAVKIFKPTDKAPQDAATVDVNDLLAPAKKRKRTAPKAKGKAAARSRQTDTGDSKENAETVLADVAEGSGCSRKRWWLDDVLAAMIHAAGHFL